MPVLIGAIADDFTGATDLASMLVNAGMKTVQFIGVPEDRHLPTAASYDAVVIALKSRTTAAEDAIALSRQSLAWLRRANAEQIFFKYCSTFDSTPAGNIGPVADMLMEETGAEISVVCPALPANGRTIYKGNLFVGDVRLDESGMRHHPLTPMTDANILRLLASQTSGKVALVDYETVRAGRRAIRDRLDVLEAEGVRYAVVDAIVDDDLEEIGAACQEHALVTGGSGLGLGIARSHHLSGSGVTRIAASGLSAVISGSCSQATNLQVTNMQAVAPSLRINPLDAAKDIDGTVRSALDWASRHLGDLPVLIYATAGPEDVHNAQQTLGVQGAGEVVERTLARIAHGLVSLGVGKLIVAGGETSGAVVSELGIDSLMIGPAIAPGVPWTLTHVAGIPLALALKSGNFGQPDFFLSAWETLA